MPVGAQLVLMLVFGVAGWHHARHLEKKYGASAWGLPSWVWGVITAFSLLLGAILLYVAEKPLKRQAAPSFGAQPSFAGPPSFATQPAFATQPVAHTPTAGVTAPAMAPTAPAAATGVAAGWHPDPSGRHQLRWWDGERWTADVHDDGVTSTEA